MYMSILVIVPFNIMATNFRGTSQEYKSYQWPERVIDVPVFRQTGQQAIFPEVVVPNNSLLADYQSMDEDIQYILQEKVLYDEGYLGYTDKYANVGENYADI